MNKIPLNSKLLVQGKETPINCLVKKSSYAWYCCYLSKTTYSLFLKDINNHSLFYVTHLVLLFSEGITTEDKKILIDTLKQQVYPYLQWLCIINGDIQVHDIYVLYMENKIRLKEILLLNEPVNPSYVNQKSLRPLTVVENVQEKDDNESEDLLFFSSEPDGNSHSDGNQIEKTVPLNDVGSKETLQEMEKSESENSTEKEIESKDQINSPSDEEMSKQKKELENEQKKELENEQKKELENEQKEELENEQNKVISQMNSTQQTMDKWSLYSFNTLYFLYNATFTYPILFCYPNISNYSFSQQDFSSNNAKYKSLVFTFHPRFVPISDPSPWYSITKSNEFISVHLIIKNEGYKMVISKRTSMDVLHRAVLLFLQCFKYNNVGKIELFYINNKLECSDEGLQIPNNSDIHVIITEQRKRLPWNGIVETYESGGTVITAHVPPSVNLQELLLNEALFSVHYLLIYIPILQDKSPLYMLLCRTPLPSLRELVIFTHFKSSTFHVELLISLLHMSLSLIRVCGMKLLRSVMHR